MSSSIRKRGFPLNGWNFFRDVLPLMFGFGERALQVGLDPPAKGGFRQGCPFGAATVCSGRGHL